MTNKKILKQIQFITLCYLTLMFSVYPLYFTNGYDNLASVKYVYMRTLSGMVFTIVIALVMLIVVRRFLNKEAYQLDKLSITDRFVVAYCVAVIISYIHSPYRAELIEGFKGWYMGLITQLIFVVSYFVVSRYFEYRKIVVYLTFSAAIITHVVAIMNRFYLDPLGMFKAIEADITTTTWLLSTGGNTNWYSSYLCLMFAVGVGLYNAKLSRIDRYLLASYIVIAAASLVTQNSESALVALFCIIVVITMVSLRTVGQMRRLLEVLIFVTGSFIIVGVMQMIWKNHTHVVSPLFTMCSQGMATKILFVVLVITYLILTRYDQLCVIKWNVKRIQSTSVVVIVLGIVMMLVVVYLVSTNQALVGLFDLESIDHLKFDANWGNGRGFIWEFSAMMYQEYPLLFKLFGCGPDGYYYYAYESYKELLQEDWGYYVITNAHNEWFTMFLNSGLLGGVSYLGIFVAQFIRISKSMEQSPIQIGIAACILGYVVHNIFCYQQVISTPLMFLILGLGEYLIRNKNGICN